MVCMIAAVCPNATCPDPYEIALQYPGDHVRIHDIDLCECPNIHAGDEVNLYGNEATFYIPPPNVSLTVVCETLPIDDGSYFDVSLSLLASV